MASSEDNEHRDSRVARLRSDMREAGKQVFLAGAWVALVLGLAWAFGYGMCYLAGRGDYLKFAGGAMGIIIVVFLFALIIKRTDKAQLSRNFFVLGATLMALSVLVQSVSGQPIFWNWGVGNVDSEILACRKRVMNILFGDLGFVWGIATALFGVAWRYIEDRRAEWRQRIRSRIDRLENTDDEIRKAREWIILREELQENAIGVDNETLQRLQKDLDDVRNHHREKWRVAILGQLDWRFFRGASLNDGDILEFIDLLSAIHEFDNETNDFKRWSEIKELSSVLGELDEKHDPDNRKELLSKLQIQNLDIILELWSHYDVLVREWVTVLIEQWIKRLPYEKEKNNVKDKIQDLRHPRRLTRHQKIRALFPSLAVTPTYRFYSPWLTSNAPTLKSDIGKWLGKRKNPFGMARAEWETNINKLYYPKPDVQDLMKDHALAWIVAPSGSGRTALARNSYTELSKPWSGVFPLYMSLSISHQVNVRQLLLEQLLHNLVNAWGGILQRYDPIAMEETNEDANAPKPHDNGPIAFLDLDYHEQRKVAQLLFWEMGSLDVLWAWLASLRLDLTQSKEGKALKARLQFLLRFPPPLQLPEAWMMELASARPVGLEITYVMIELDNNLTETQSKIVAELASDLQKHQVYWKLIASLPSPSAYPSARLSWSKSELVEMLETRDRSQVLQTEAKELLAQFIYEYADGLPREMMQLGNVALALRAKKGALSPASEGVLTKKDIEDAIAHWQKERQHATP